MDSIVLIIMSVFTLTIMALVVMVAKLLFDTSGNSHGQTTYIMKVSENGDIKIKRYRGTVKYWNDVN